MRSQKLFASFFKDLYGLAISGERRVEFRGELFNLPNHSNLAVPIGRTAFSSVDAAGKGVIAPDWGVISSTVAPSRQVQVRVKVVW